MGHSLGGGIATYYTSHNNKYDIKSLILLAPNTYPKRPFKLFANLRNQYAAELNFDNNYFSLKDKYKSINMPQPKSIINKLKYLRNSIRLFFFMSKTNFINDYENLTIPVKVFWGSEDLTLGEEMFSTKWGKLNKNNVQTFIFQKYGHNFFFPKYKEIINNI